MQNSKEFQFAHLVWRSPHAPSFFYDSGVQMFVGRLLQTLKRKHRDLRILEAYREQAHLDMLLGYHEDKVLDQISREVTAQLQLLLERRPPARAPLYFWTEDGRQGAFLDPRQKIPISPDALPVGYKIASRPSGGHARWVFQHRHLRFWAQRRIQILYPKPLRHQVARAA